MRLRSCSTLSFAEKHLKVSYGPFDRHKMPMIIEPLETIDREIGKLFIVKGSIQSIKTLMMQLRALRMMLIDPMQIRWYSPTKDAVREFADEKFFDLVESAEPLQRIRFRDRHSVTKFKYKFPFSLMQLLSGGVEANCNSKTAQEIIVDEPWLIAKNHPGHLAGIHGRRTSFGWDWKEMYATTGPTEGDEVDQDWKASDQRQFRIECPGCKEMIYLETGDRDTEHGLKYDRNETTFDSETNMWNYSALRETVRYRCACGYEMRYSDRLLKDLLKRWEYVSVNDRADDKIRGWEFTALYHVDWRDLAVEFVKAHAQRKKGSLKELEDYVRKREAKSWNERKLIKPVSSTKPYGGYVMGEPWKHEAKDGEGRPLRFMWVDVQRNYFRPTVRMWAKTAESRLLWTAKVFTPSEIHEIQRRFDLLPNRIALDSGDNQHDRVYRICSKYGWLAMNGTKRQAYLNKESGLYYIFSEPIVHDAFAGTVHQGARNPVIEFLFSSNSAKNRLQLLRTNSIGAGTEDDPKRPLWTIADDTPEFHVTEIDGERPVERKRKGSEETYTEWLQVEENHGFDSEVGCTVFAAMAGIVDSENEDASKIVGS